MKKERKKERKIFTRSNFTTQTKVSRTLQVVLYLDSEVLLVYKLFALLLACLSAHTPIAYVQDTIVIPTTTT